MKSKKTGINILGIIFSLVMAAAGGIIIKMNWLPEIVALPYVLIGIASGMFGLNLGSIIQAKTIKNHPAEARRIEIEQKDERNQLINNTAKAKAFSAMIYINSALMLTFALMNAGVTVILLLVGANLLVIGIYIFFFNKLYKEM